MNCKKFCCLLLAAALFVSSAVFPAAGTEALPDTTFSPDGEAEAAVSVSFTDTVGHPAEEAIRTFASLGILSGDGTGNFNPDNTIIRGDMCTLVTRIFTYTEVSENPFLDLDPAKWYAEPMLQLHAAGIIQGDGAGYVNPTAAITWEEALVLFSRAFGFEERFDVLLPYEDAGSISPWSLGYISTLYADGYLPETAALNPKQPFTRADAVTILNNIISKLGWEAAGKMIVHGKLVPFGNYPYDPNNFYAVDSRIYYVGEDVIPMYGIDVSNHQGDIDWNAVAADGAEFAIIRLGYRGYTLGALNMDTRFVQNIEGALAAGLKVGVYFFSQAISVEEAVEEARFVLNALEPYRDQITFPVAYDWEDIGTTNARTYKLPTEILNACALAFCGEITAAGYEPLIYFYPNLGKKFYDLDVISQYPFWYCYYNGVYPDLERPFRMWQYTSSGSIAGIQGKVDWNICFWPYE